MGKKLVVYIPGINQRPKAWDLLISRLSDELKPHPDFRETEWAGWDHNCNFFSFGSLLKVSNRFCDWMDLKWFTSGGYEEIILMGHSIGGAIARQAYIISAGAYEDRPGSDWWRAVDKFVLLAALNRGINTQQVLIKVYDTLVNSISFLCLGKKMVAQDAMFGSDFITDLRLQWIKFMKGMPADRIPEIIQILGSEDSIVSREDSIDLEQFPNAYHIPIPDVNHGNLPRLNRGKNPELRYEVFRDVILGERLSERAEEKEDSVRRRNVVFILHGIRASNRGWVRKLEDLVYQRIPDVEVVSSSYGYLSALEFFIPFLHIRPLRWFHTKYADYYASNPEADFYFVGHSNGTYILGRSLLALRGMHFNRIILAGSVLPSDFPWRKLYRRGQYAELRNDQASEDFPVGFLCSGLQGLGRKDIGTGGYEGFEDDDNSVIQYAFHSGDHGAALEDENLTNFADFLVQGIEHSPRPNDLVEENTRFSLISRISPWLFRLLLLTAIALFVYALLSSKVALVIVLIGLIALIAWILKVL